MFKKRRLSAAIKSPTQMKNLSKLFEELNITHFTLMPTDWNRESNENKTFWQGQCTDWNKFNSTSSYPFGGEAFPKLEKYTDQDIVKKQKEIVRKAYECCKSENIKFVFGLLLPVFPFNEKKIVKKEYPNFFTEDGVFDLNSSEYIPKIETVLEEIRANYPKVEGFDIWVAEGAGSTVREFKRDDLENIENWFEPWCSLLDSYASRKNIEVSVFSHQYVHTRQTRKGMHDVIRKFSNLEIMEDITWPEENTITPPFGYMDPEYVSKLASNAKVIINFLLDTEYVGQGRIPSVFPNWWKEGLKKCQDLGIDNINARINWWDDYSTLDSWNIINLYVFFNIAENLDANIREITEKAISRKFNKEIKEDLTDLLLESRRINYLVHSINGVNCTDHSAFPKPHFLHEEHFPTELNMKRVNDLFKKPGKKIYKSPKEDLHAGDEWRTQLRLRSTTGIGEVAKKDVAIEWLETATKRIKRIKQKTSKENYKFIKKSYDLWLEFAKAMKLFVEVANSYSNYKNGQRKEKSKIKESLENLRSLGENFSEEYPSSYLWRLPIRIEKMANFVEKNVKEI